MTKEEYWEQKKKLLFKDARSDRAFELGCRFSEHRIEELERENSLLGERCNQLLNDKGNLTDQIADIKANCDLAIEGRDIKIKELEEDYKALQTSYNILKDNDEKIIKEMGEQIEKMKCCGNCKYSNQESVYSIVCKVGGVDKSDYINIDDNQVCDKWEIKENDRRRN